MPSSVAWLGVQRFGGGVTKSTGLLPARRAVHLPNVICTVHNLYLCMWEFPIIGLALSFRAPMIYPPDPTTV